MTPTAPAQRPPSDVVVFRVDELVCGLDIVQIQEIKRILSHTPVRHAPPYVRGLLNIRGQIVTLVDVGQRLGLPPRPLRRAAPAIVVGLGSELVGLLVDEVDDVVEVDASHLSEPPSNLGDVEGRFFGGVLRTPGGLVALVDKDRIAGPDAPADARKEAR